MSAPVPHSLRLLVVGLNHRSAPIELRETLSFTPAQAADATAAFYARFPRAELVILSTCNRVELYMARPVSAEPTLEGVASFLADYHKLRPDQLQGHLYHHEDRAMIEHLFSVASSLDSMVIGETQILSQVKHAYLHGIDPKRGAAGGGVGRVLHALFQRALAAAKDVHERTQLSTGHLSVASVAVDLAASVFDRFDDKTVLCVGAGKMASLMLRHLAELKPRRLLITNRTAERAHALAAEFSANGGAGGGGGGAQARPFEQLDALLAEADILLTSTGAPDPIITESRFKAVLKPRRYRPIVMVDIAVPRDVEPAVATLANVFLYNIDDLQEVAAGNRGKRDQEIASARTLLQSHVDDFLRWSAARDVGPLVKALYAQANALARAELDLLLAKHPDLPDDHRADLELLTHRLVQKLLHSPVTQLTARAETTARPMLAEALRRLFDIPDSPPPADAAPPTEASRPPESNP